VKILLANNALNHFYGTETWTYTMAKELIKEHEVEVFTFYKGLMSDRISKFCKIVDSIDDNYDLAIINHTSCFNLVPKSIFRIFTSHSLINTIELFPEGADKCVAITEEIARDKFPIIRNGIDCDRFNYLRPINNELKKVLYLSHPHYGGGDKDMLGNACTSMGIKLLTINEQIWNMPDAIKEVDLVVGFGRGILEAMACGRNVISADYRPYYMRYFSGGGFVDENNFDELKKFNFTGRGDKQIIFTKESIKEEFGKYNCNKGTWLRGKILSEFNVKKTARQYLDLYTNRQLYVKRNEDFLQR